MIRYHSFYPAHKEARAGHLMNGTRSQMLDCVRSFSPYDLYSKSRRTA